jgi:hypothetical protein
MTSGTGCDPAAKGKKAPAKAKKCLAALAGELKYEFTVYEGHRSRNK